MSVDFVEDLLGDEESITINNKSFNMKEVREFEKKHGNELFEKITTAVVTWDDVMQFTTLGIIELLLDLDEFEISEEDKEWDYNIFFGRPTELVESNNFIKWFFKYYFNIELTDLYIDEFAKHHYEDILEISPMSNLLITIIRSEQLFRELYFAFRYSFGNEEELMRSISNEFIGYNNTRFIPLIIDNADEYQYLTALHDRNPNMKLLFVRNLVYTLEFIMSSELDNAGVVVTKSHNGADDEILEALEMVIGDARSGPRNSEIVFYEEGIALC